MDFEISKSKKRSKQPKYSKMGVVSEPSLPVLIKAEPEPRYSSKRNYKNRAVNSTGEYSCECGTKFSMRKNLLKHQKQGCRIFEVLQDIRELHTKLTKNLAPLTQAPQLLTDLLKKHSQLSSNYSEEESTAVTDGDIVHGVQSEVVPDEVLIDRSFSAIPV